MYIETKAARLERNTGGIRARLFTLLSAGGAICVCVNRPTGSAYFVEVFAPAPAFESLFFCPDVAGAEDVFGLEAALLKSMLY